MPNTINTPEFWNKAYQEDDSIFSQVKVLPYFVNLFSDESIDKSVNILIPGAGNAFEAQFLHELGYRNVYVLDFAPTPILAFKNRVPSFPESHVLQADFFEFSKQTAFINHFDYILEKSFFCAITADKRDDYVQAVYRLLQETGKLCGTFVNGYSEKSLQSDTYPPYGCDVAGYKALFENYFDILTMKAGKADNLIVYMAKKAQV